MPARKPPAKKPPRTEARSRKLRENLSTIGVLFVWQVARELTVSETTVYDLIRKGQLKAVKIGRKSVRVMRSELERYITVLALGMTAQPLLFPIEGRTLPRVQRRPAFRIVMMAGGREFYITTTHGSAEKAQRYAARLEALGGRYRYEAREVGVATA